MTLSISDCLMESTETRHRATFEPDRAADGKGAWVVSWAYMRCFDRNAAVTAMTLAEFVAQGVTGPEHKFWPHMKNFAGELGLTAEEAVHLIEGTKEVEGT